MSWVIVLWDQKPKKLSVFYKTLLISNSNKRFWKDWWYWLVLLLCYQKYSLDFYKMAAAREYRIWAAEDQRLWLQWLSEGLQNTDIHAVLHPGGGTYLNQGMPGSSPTRADSGTLFLMHRDFCLAQSGSGDSCNSASLPTRSTPATKPQITSASLSGYWS